jgi:hypothetical protein
MIPIAVRTWRSLWSEHLERHNKRSAADPQSYPEEPKPLAGACLWGASR